MKTKFHVKAGDEVVVIAGDAKDRIAKVVQVFPSKNRVVLEAVSEDESGSRAINPVKKHERARDEANPGGIVEREGSIHISNVMLKSKYDARKGKSSS